MNDDTPKFTILKNNEVLRKALNVGDSDFFALMTKDGVKGHAIFETIGSCVVIKHLEFNFFVRQKEKLFDALLRAVAFSATNEMHPYVFYETDDENMKNYLLGSIFSLVVDGTNIALYQQELGLSKEKTVFVDGVKLFSSPCRGHEFI